MATTLTLTGILYPDGYIEETAYTSVARAVFGYGLNSSGSPVSITNHVSRTGVVATDTTGVGTTRANLAAASYGVDKAIFGYGDNDGFAGTNYSLTNLVSNVGVVATDTTGIGTARTNLAAAGYGSDKAIFGYGYTTTSVSLTNLVSSAGVVATDTTGVGSSRHALAAAGYGGDKAIFGYGTTSSSFQNYGSRVSLTNLVSNVGVVATDTTGVGTARIGLAAAGYGGNKAIFGYGFGDVPGGGIGSLSITNLVSDTGVVATYTTGVGSTRSSLAAAGYGGDKAIFGYGYNGSYLNSANLVSSLGVVATDTVGVGTARQSLAAASYYA